jgi:DHA2 family methylenomycin A resistance protein-like MFS transporter
MTLIPMQGCIAQMQAYGYAAQVVLHSMFRMDAVERSPSSPGAWPLVTVALGYVMAMLDVTVVNVALSSISDELSMTLAGQVWIVDAYTLTFAALLLAGGAMANRFGARAVYAAGIAAFVAASTLCAAAASGAELIGARLLQGIAASLFIPSSLGLLARAYPDEHERARVLGLWSAIVSASAASGPLVGGLVITWLGWRAIFWLNLPLGVLAIWLAQRHLAVAPRHPQPLHLAAHLYGTFALGGLAYVLIQGPSVGWDSPRVLAAAIIAVLAVAAFARHQRHATQPLLPRALLHDAAFLRINAIGLLINFEVFGALFLLTLYNQQERQASPLATGLNLLPLMAMYTFGNLISARVVARYGKVITLRSGLILATTGAAAAAAVAVLDGGLPSWPLDVFIAIANLGAAIAIPAVTSSVLGHGDRQHTNTAAAILNANRQIGALVGVAVVGVIMHGLGSWALKLPTSLTLLTIAFAAAAVLAVRSSGPHRTSNPAASARA